MKLRPIDHLVDLAKTNPVGGIVEEPRVFFDVIRLPASTTRTQRSGALAFVNGENFPIVFTHLLSFVRPYEGDDGVVGSDEAIIERIGLRLERDGQVYQNIELQPAPLWHNVVATGNPAISRGHATWTLDRPLVLPMRGALDVEAARTDISLAPDVTFPVGISFRGTGLLSGQPVVLGTQADLGATKVTLDAEALRNPRAEPIAITDFTVWTAPPAGQDGLGDLRLVNLSIKTVAAGTGRDWLQGPEAPGSGGRNRCPAYLLGQTAGRCITHRFPNVGIRLEPGDRFYAEAVAFDDSAYDVDLALAVIGTIFVT